MRFKIALVLYRAINNSFRCGSPRLIPTVFFFFFFLVYFASKHYDIILLEGIQRSSYARAAVWHHILHIHTHISTCIRVDQPHKYIQICKPCTYVPKSVFVSTHLYNTQAHTRTAPRTPLQPSPIFSSIAHFIRTLFVRINSQSAHTQTMYPCYTYKLCACIRQLCICVRTQRNELCTTQYNILHCERIRKIQNPSNSTSRKYPTTSQRVAFCIQTFSQLRASPTYRSTTNSFSFNNSISTHNNKKHNKSKNLYSTI